MEERLDEAFGFAVCLGAADAGVAGCEADVAAAALPAALEAVAVVGEYLLDLDLVAVVEAAAVCEEVERVAGGLGRVEAGVGEPCVVVDADEQVLPAGPALGADRPAGRRVERSRDPAELFDVDMDQLARPLALVEDDRLRLLRIEAGAAVAAEDRVHRRSRQPELPADRMRPRLQPTPRAQHSPLDPPADPPGGTMRPARAILEALPAAMPSDPLRPGLPRTANHGRRGRDRHPGRDQRHQPLSLTTAQSSISMKIQDSPPLVATPTSRSLGGLFALSYPAGPSTTSLGTTTRFVSSTGGSRVESPQT